jgi:hypothetical protein
MKKFLFPLLIICLIFGLQASPVHAQACPTGSDSACVGENGAPNKLCDPDTRQCVGPSSAAFDDNTVGVGGSCKTENDCRGSATVCNSSTHKCEYDTSAAAPPAANPSQPSQQTTAAPSISPAGNFVQLTSFPGLDTVANSDAPDFATFFNNLYKICIGLAAILAVIQIAHAGFLWMTAGDSAEKVGQARHLIGASIFGLVLVLSPVIVFSIVNPNVLRLNLNFSALKSANATATQPQQPAGNGKNDLGQKDICQNNAGGCAVAPQPTAPNCPHYYPNSQIVTPNGAQPDNQQVMCCGSQTSNLVQCGIESRTNQKDNSETYYCGCNIKPNITYAYYDVYSIGHVEGAGQSFKLQGVAPAQYAAFTKFSKDCTDAGGKVGKRTTHGLFQDVYEACPTNLNIANASGSNVTCQAMELSCKSK